MYFPSSLLIVVCAGFSAAEDARAHSPGSPEIMPAASERRASDGERDASSGGLDVDVASYRRFMDAADARADDAPTQDTTPPDLTNRRIFSPDEAASVEQHPYMAAVLLHGELCCSGLVLDAKCVLAAAHCLQLQYTNRIYHEYVNILSVRVGSSNSTAGGLTFAVADVFYHPKYAPQTLANNLAVLVVGGTLPLGGRLPVAAMAYARAPTLAVGMDITFLGWGAATGGGAAGGARLQQLRLPVYDPADCRELYGRALVTNDHFCAGFLSVNRNLCNHDAGGGAVRGGVLVGVLSFTAARCDQLDRPAVFAAAAAAAPWLDRVRRRVATPPAPASPATGASLPRDANSSRPQNINLGDLQDWMNKQNLI